MEKSLTKLREILSKPYENRTREDVKEIGTHIINVKFFASFISNKFIFNECCAYITYEYIEANQYVFHAGDIGDKFYILIQGEAAILIPMKSDGRVFFKEVLVVRDGASFGELALIDKKPRSASIYTKADCHFAILDKQNYQRILASIMKKKQEEIVRFLQDQEIFRGITKGSLAKLSYCFEEKLYKKDVMLFNEGEAIEYLYLIKSGEVKILKDFMIKKVEFDEKNFYKEKLNKVFKHKAEVSILGKGECLGLYEMMSGIYGNTAICVSDVLVLKISLNNFTRRIRSKEIMDIINSRKEIKEAIYGDNIINIKRVIRDKESSPYRKINIDGIENISLSPNMSSNLSLASSSVDRCITRIQRKKIMDNKNFLVINELKYVKKKPILFKKNTSRLSKAVNRIEECRMDDREFLNKSSEIVSKSYNTSMIQRLMPFGRVKSCKVSKRSKIINIHMEDCRKKSASTTKCRSSFYFNKKYLQSQQGIKSSVAIPNYNKN